MRFRYDQCTSISSIFANYWHEYICMNNYTYRARVCVCVCVCVCVIFVNFNNIHWLCRLNLYVNLQRKKQYLLKNIFTNFLVKTIQYHFNVLNFYTYWHILCNNYIYILAVSFCIDQIQMSDRKLKIFFKILMSYARQRFIILGKIKIYVKAMLNYIL